MAHSAAVSHAHAICALPRRRHSIRTTSTSSSRRDPCRHLRTALSLPAAPPPPATLDRVLSDLESRPRLLTPSLLASLLSALPRHPSPRRHLARLRRLLPVSLLRRHPPLALRLLHLHASLGLLSYAHHLFDHLLSPRAREDAYPWNCLIAGYAHLGRHQDALARYLQMDEEGVPGDRLTFIYALQACAGVRSVALGQAVHREVVRAGMALDVSVCDALVDMYANCGHIQRARQVFDAMPVKDDISWNIMLAGCLQNGPWPQAMEILRRMLGEGHKPDSAALSTMLSRLSLHRDNDKWGSEIHAWVIRHGLETELLVANALIGMYSVKNEVNHALTVFESMTTRDLVSWNGKISAHRKDYEVLMVFRRMVESGVQPDELTFSIVLSACDDLGLVEGGMRLFSEMENVYKIQPSIEHYTCMVNMLGKAGMINEAYDFVSKRAPLNSELMVLRALLHACSVHGNIRIGEIVAKRLFDLEPDNVHNFITLMEIYQKTGRLEEVEKVEKMVRDKGL